MALARSHRLGLDIGGTKVVFALADADGQLLAQARLDRWTSGRSDRDLATLEAEARSLLASRGLDARALIGVGISAPGPLDADAGVLLAPPNLPGWRDVPLVAELARRLDAPTRLENDANAAALAEWRHGAGQGAGSVLYLTMSTGVGAGLVIDGRLVRGAHSQAGEFGHAPLIEGGRRCACGLVGCLEAHVGGVALAAQLREAIAGGRASAALELAGGDPARITAAVWCAALRVGDPLALELREQFLRHLARGIAVAQSLIDPERVILGTIIQRNPDLFLDELRARVRATSRPELHAAAIVPGALGELLPARAALEVAEMAALEAT